MAKITKAQRYAMRVSNVINATGLSMADYNALRRIGLTLHKWQEHEANGVIQRDEETNKCYSVNPDRPERRYKTADRETGAIKRAEGIVARYPNLILYIQGDCRGDAVYILRKDQVREGERIDSIYSSRGVSIN